MNIDDIALDYYGTSTSILVIYIGILSFTHFSNS
jgi:hypothetical protein